MKRINDSPPTLFNLFPDLKTVEEKARKFLEIHCKNAYSLRRSGRELGINPKTVKAIYEHLIDTPEGVRFRDKLLEETEDFYSARTLTLLFEDYAKEIQRVENMIEQATAKDKLNLIREKRMWMNEMLKASLACRPYIKVASHKALEESIDEENARLNELLTDFDPSDKSDPKPN